MPEPPPSGQQPPYGQGPPGQQPAPGQQPYQQPAQPYPQAQPRRRERAGWGALSGVLVIMLVIVLGGHALGGTVGQIGGDVPLGEPVAVTDSVAVSLPEGWQVLGQLDGGLPGLAVASDVGNAHIRVADGTGTAEDILNFYLNEVLAPQAQELGIGEAREVELPSGEAGRVGYLGVFPDVDVPLEGEVIGISTPSGIPVIVDGWAGEGAYAPIQDQVLAMAGSVVTA